MVTALQEYKQLEQRIANLADPSAAWVHSEEHIAELIARHTRTMQRIYLHCLTPKERAQVRGDRISCDYD